MSFVNQFCKMAGYLHPNANWKYGRTRVVYAYDYSGYEKKYLDSAYKNPVCILNKPNSPEMKRLLSDLTMSDKLIIVSHADPDGLAEIEQTELVQRLLQYGLRNVGVIKFHSCELGKNTWLDDFAIQLMGKGVRFGWVSGPIGDYVYGPFNRWVSRPGAKSFMQQIHKGKYHIVKGNTVTNFKGSRYTAES